MEKVSKRNSTGSMDEYLEALPEKTRATLENLRKTIKSVVPRAEEVISYQIPSFKYNGMLVGFAAFKEHCSFFVMSGSMLKGFKKDLEPYETTKSAIHFSLDKPLPTRLVKKLVVARVKENEARLLAKNIKKPATKKRVAKS